MDSDIATVYVWESPCCSFNMDYVVWALGGREAPTENELKITSSEEGEYHLYLQRVEK